MIVEIIVSNQYFCVYNVDLYIIMLGNEPT